jgi:hypothetical protein
MVAPVFVGIKTTAAAKSRTMAATSVSEWFLDFAKPFGQSKKKFFTEESNLNKRIVFVFQDGGKF